MPLPLFDPEPSGAEKANDYLRRIAESAERIAAALEQLARPGRWRGCEGNDRNGDFTMQCMRDPDHEGDHGP